MEIGIKRSALLGIPVVSENDVSIIGQFEDIILMPGKRKIGGILFTTLGWKNNKRFVPLKNIISFGKHAIVINSGEDLGNKAEKYSFSGSWLLGSEIVDIPLIRDDGEQLGRISDIILDNEGKNILGYEVSKGFFDDLMDGRVFLSYDVKHMINDHAFVIMASSDAYLQPYNMGIKNLFYSKIE